jgi:hypothetical protein
MILLRPDCLVFRRADGVNIPCSVRQVITELLGESAEEMGETFLQNVSEAVLQYFKQELGWNSVSISEFSLALSKVLRSFGFNCDIKQPQDATPPVLDMDLTHLASESGDAFELFFFPRLRQELRCKLDQSPRVVRFRGLRQCVKHLTGSKRWSSRCQDLNDRIVEYLRHCMFTETAASGCALVII